ncbi:MAG: hypothetical protein ACJAVV_000264 [Alphaproteobacteria bacterium]|jgi:hypothetical protein
MALVSCILLSICGLLSKPVSALQQEAKALESTSSNFMHLKSDPTRPPSVIVQQLAPELMVDPKYELTAIFMRNNQQYAVINGNVVKTGDPVADMFVSGISGTTLTMKYGTSSRDAAKDDLVIELSGAVSVKKQVTK